MRHLIEGGAYSGAALIRVNTVVSLCSQYFQSFCSCCLGITLVDEAKGDDEEDEPSPELVAGVQLAYSKRRPQRKVKF